MDGNSPDIAVVASLYTTKNTIVQGDGSGSQLILRANPRRWYVRIAYHHGLNGNYNFQPGPPSGDMIQTFTADNPAEFKFKDCPSIVTGEFYGTWDATTFMIITEVIYTGGS